MLAKRIIPCLDVKDNQVVKGMRFAQHQYVGDIIELAQYYSEMGADELVFYDITASCDNRTVAKAWVKQVAEVINIPFCVAGGINNLFDAEEILMSGADKISINTPAINDPSFIYSLAKTFGQQCVVVGIDSLQINDDYFVCRYTGDTNKSQVTSKRTAAWIKEVTDLGAGEIVLNCMNQDGMRCGYDMSQLILMRSQTHLPFVASGGAGCMQDFLSVFKTANVSAALAASVFHSKKILLPTLKKFLSDHHVQVRA